MFLFVVDKSISLSDYQQVSLPPETQVIPVSGIHRTRCQTVSSLVSELLSSVQTQSGQQTEVRRQKEKGLSDDSSYEVSNCLHKIVISSK